MTTTVNITMVAGETMARSMTVTQDDVAVNLTGTAIRYVLNAPTPVIKYVTSGITVTNAAGGAFTLTLLPADTIGLNGIYKHEIKLETSGGVVTAAMDGFLTVSPTLILDVTP
jgi:hypothetical protein